MSEPNDPNQVPGTNGGDLLTSGRPGVSQPPDPPAPEPIDDPGSQALSEALRSSFVIVKIIMVLLVVVFFASGVFTVPPQEKAIRLTFGKPVGSGDHQFLGPGLHWSYPRPIDEIVRVPISEYQTVMSTIGWYATTPEMEAAGTDPGWGAAINPATDSYTLTGDGNIIHVRARLRYRISNPVNYALNFVNASNVVQNALNNALVYSSLHFNIDQALRREVGSLKDMVKARVEQLVDQQAFGISVEQVDLESKAPLQVKDIFNQYIAADIERRKVINQAEAYANSNLTTAQGIAASIINVGHTDKTRLVQAVGAEAQYFQDQVPQFKENPSLFMSRNLSEVMARILTNTQDKIFLPARRDGKSRELRLQLSREPQRPPQAAVP